MRRNVRLAACAAMLVSSAVPATAADAPDERANAVRALDAARVPVSGARPVQYAGLGDAHIVGLLLGAGIAVDAPEPGRQLRALHSAAGQGHGRIVGLLLKAGADVDAPDDFGCSALSAASWRGHVSVMRALLAAGAASAPATPDCLPLHQALMSGQRAAVVLLLAHGADVQATDRDGRDARALAVRLGRESMLKANVEPDGKRD